MAKPVKTIKVTLNTDKNANPNVTVSDRFADVTGHKIRWEKATASVDFDFVDLVLSRSGFPGQDIAENKRRISCNNNDITGKYKYTITVKRLGKEYSTTTRTDKGPPDGDKPVIRNR